MTIVVTTDGQTGGVIDSRLTLLELINEAAHEIGLEKFERVIGAPGQTEKELQHFMQEGCEEIVRRVDWSELLAQTDFAGTGTNTAFELPPDFSRLSRGGAVYVGGTFVRGGLSADEFNSLSATEGQPRYLKLNGNNIKFWPYMSDTQTATVHYQSKTYTLAGYDYFVADDDILLFPHQLAQKALVWRWRRHVGQPFEDYLAEFEAALLDYADFDLKERLA